MPASPGPQSVRNDLALDPRRHARLAGRDLPGPLAGRPGRRPARPASSTPSSPPSAIRSPDGVSSSAVIPWPSAAAAWASTRVSRPGSSSIRSSRGFSRVALPPARVFCRPDPAAGPGRRGRHPRRSGGARSALRFATGIVWGTVLPFYFVTGVADFFRTQQGTGGRPGT